MSKFLELLNGAHLQNGGIFPPPVPEMEITCTTPSGRSVIVECTKLHHPHDIVEFVQRERNGKWMFGIWSNGDDNPYKNNYGLWTWVLVKE